MRDGPTNRPCLYRKLLLCAALGCLALTACGRPDPTFELSGRAMGTSWSVQIAGSLDESGREALGHRIRDRIAATEALFSTWMADSEVSRFNESVETDWQSVPLEVCTLVARSIEISRMTDGAFDITVGPVVNAWGFGPGPDIADEPDAAALEFLMDDVGYELLDTDCGRPAIRKHRPGTKMDLSGIAKGHAIDAVAEVLEAAGETRYLVEIGGELRGRGLNGRGEPWNVAIENPLDPALRPAGALRLADAAMATSGDYRNVVELGRSRYSHAIDPRLGRPITHTLTAVTVVEASAADADAWATGLLVLGPDEGPGVAERHGIAATFLIRDDDGIAVESTRAFERLAEQD